MIKGKVGHVRDTIGEVLFHQKVVFILNIASVQHFGVFLDFCKKALSVFGQVHIVRKMESFFGLYLLNHVHELHVFVGNQTRAVIS